MFEQTGFETQQRVQAGKVPVVGRGLLIAQLLILLFLGLQDAQVVWPILYVLKADFAISIASAGIAVTSYSAAAAFWALIIGPLSDQFGRLIFLRTAAIVFSVAALLAGIAPSFAVFIGARVLAGLVGGTISACVIAQMADLFAYHERGRAMGWIGAMYFVPAVIGLPAAAWITGQWGWRVLYFSMAILAVLPAGFLPRRVVKRRRHPNGRASAQTNCLRVIRNQLVDYVNYWRSPVTRPGLLLALAFSATVSGLLTYLSTWLTEAFGMPVSTIGLVFLVTGVASTAGALTGGWLSDRLGKRRIILISSGLLAGVLFLVSAAKSSSEVYIILAIGGLMMALREGPYHALITELVPQNQRGAFVALRNSTAQIAIALSAAICGLLYVRIGFVAVTVFAGSFSLVAMVIAWTIPEPKLKTRT